MYECRKVTFSEEFAAAVTNLIPGDTLDFEVQGRSAIRKLDSRRFKLRPGLRSYSTTA